MYLALALLFALVVAIFAVQNAVPVGVSFLTWRFETSLVLVILGGAALGALSVGVLGVFKQIGMSFRLWDQEARSRRLEAEIKKLKASEEQMTMEVERLRRELMARQPAVNGTGGNGGGKTGRAG